MANFNEQLRDGQKLCKLINKLMPDKIKKINTGTMAFKLMENIGLFTQACKDYGLIDAETFQVFFGLKTKISDRLTLSSTKYLVVIH
jgi:hypothetical protein